MSRRVTLLLPILAVACGGGNAASRPDCPAGQTSLDGTCVSQQVADYVGCIRATGATVASDSARSLSAAAGVAGVTGSTQADVKDKLEKRYAQVSDANSLEIIHNCYQRTGSDSVPPALAAKRESAGDCPGGGKMLGTVCVPPSQVDACACEPWSKLRFKARRDGKVMCETGADCAAAFGVSDGQCSAVATDGVLQSVAWCYTKSSCPAAHAGQYPWTYCGACPQGTHLLEGQCLPEAQYRVCQCLFWGDIDVTVKKSDGTVTCNGKGGCMSTLSVKGNACTRVGTDGMPTSPWCYVPEGCPVGYKGQYRWVDCEP